MFCTSAENLPNAPAASVSPDWGRTRDGLDIMIRVVLGFIVFGAVLFMADQEFAEGRFTKMSERALLKIRMTVGI